MAKKKKEVKLVECKSCYSFNSGYCILKCKDHKTFTESAKCKDDPVECLWYRKKLNES